MSNYIMLDEVLEYTNWIDLKANLKFGNVEPINFPIMFNHIYWAFLGSNIGSEQNKHRPVIVTRTSKNSPMCTIIPLTSSRLNDKYFFHIDLEEINGTAIVEQMRVIDKKRIDQPFRIKGTIAKITKNDWERINNQIIKNYSLLPL